MYLFFGLRLDETIVLAGLFGFGFLLLLLPLRTVLFVALVGLFLPSLYIKGAGDLFRLLRWPCLFGLVGKGIVLHARAVLLPRLETREHRLVAVLAGLILLSAAWSLSWEITIAQGGALIGVFAGGFLVVWGHLRGEENVLDLCDVFFKLAVFLFTVEAVYHAGGFGKPLFVDDRYAGAFLNPNGLGTAVAFLSPFVYWKHRTTERPLVRLLAKAIGVVMLVSLVLSGSRSGLLGAIVCMAAVVGYVHRARLTILAAFAVPPLVLLAVLAPKLDSEVLQDNLLVNRIVRPESLENLSDRVPMWEEAIYLWQKEPVIGYGFGMNRFARYGQVNVDMTDAIVSAGDVNYHSTHLQLALDLGAVGVGIFWLFLACVLFRGLGIYRDPDRTPLGLAGAAFFGAWLAMFGDCFVHGWAFSPGSSAAIVFWITSAVVVRVRVQLTEEEAAEEEEADLSGAAVGGAPAAG